MVYWEGVCNTFYSVEMKVKPTRVKKQISVFSLKIPIEIVDEKSNEITAIQELFETLTEIFNRPQPPKKSLPEPVLVKSIDEDASQGDHTSEEKNNETDIAA